MAWDSPVISRDQLVLFSERLDEVLPSGHLARLMVEILDQLDWKDWEASYKHEGTGRPPIHPKVMSGIVLYGLMRGVRSGRGLEEALTLRLDFRWLAEGRTIDHSTLCRFRQSHSDRLKGLFVQIALVAKQAGILSLVELAVDGTKIRSSNNRSKTLTVAQLIDFREQLELRFDELNKQADALDSRQVSEKEKLDKRSQRLGKRISAIERAIEEVEQLKKKAEPIPQKIPTTDVQSRVTKCKEGSFAPNYTPVIAVDPESGMIAATEVIANCDEKSMLPGAMDEVQQNLGEQPERVLADTIFNHSSNLIEMEKRGIALHAPIDDSPDNPAIREDLTQPVDESQRDKLPSNKGQLTNAAFVYDAENNRYFCPQGKPMEFSSSYTESLANGTTIKRHRYHASAKDCANCPLLDRCVKGKSGFRQVSRDDAEPLRDKLRQRMRTDEAKAAYDRRMQCERPFAAIKHRMGVRQFLHRGLDKVRNEWIWLVTAFNLQRMINILGARPGPD
jgi:transposase